MYVYQTSSFIRRSLSVFNGTTFENESILPSTYMKKTRLRDFHEMIHKRVHDLESGVVTSSQLLSDIDIHTPRKVHAYISYMRMLCQALLLNKRPQTFKCCDNQLCKRLFYIGEKCENWPVENSCETFADSIRNWWTMCQGQKQTQCAPCRRFCSYACESQHSVHLARAMYPYQQNLDSDYLTRKNQPRPRVTEAFRCALKRNQLIARAVRIQSMPSDGKCAVSKSEMDVYRKMWCVLHAIDHINTVLLAHPPLHHVWRALVRQPLI